VAPHALLAFDLGAESGRAYLGSLHGHRLEVRELSRFPNTMVNLGGHLHWNIAQLFQEVKNALAACAAEVTPRPASLAVDTWGVDFGLLASDGSLLGLPYAYRDGRTEGAMEELFCRIPRPRVYELTGVQFIRVNTLFQLMAMVRDQSPLLKIASDLLLMPDLFSYLLCGERRTEFTIATTSQLYNPTKRDWEDELFLALGLSPDLMQEIVPPGTVLGLLRGDIARETGISGVPVVATASHDTAAAVAAVPAEGDDWAYVSSGTWSLMGVESPQPIISDQTRDFNFTNEGGVEGTFRVLTNIMGLWLLQRCRAAWAADRQSTYQDLIQAASSAPPFKAVIEPDHADFLNPPDMPAAIQAFCRRTNQPIPETIGELSRCILESLALKYHMVLDQARLIYPRPINRIHVVGGGSRNELLCQFAANATGLPVIAGPAEAAAVGNLLVQALALRHIASLREIRDIVRLSFAVGRYEPQEPQPWHSAYDRFRELHDQVAAQGGSP